MRLLFAVLFSILMAQAVQASEMNSEMKGIITVEESDVKKTYHITAYHQAGYGTKVMLSSENENYDINLSDGDVPDNFFAKIILMGVIDPFFIMEILWGNGETPCRPYMRQDGDFTVLKINPVDACCMYEEFAKQTTLSVPVTEILRQLVTALEPELNYRFHTDGDTTKIVIKSKTSAPDPRYVSGLILVRYPEQLQSYE